MNSIYRRAVSIFIKTNQCSISDTLVHYDVKEESKGQEVKEPLQRCLQPYEKR